MKNPIYPCLWFDGKAKEAAEFYCSVFNNTQITAENPLVTTFESSGQKFMCLNGGPYFNFNPSISFFVLCETEQEFDRAWNQLVIGGSVMMPMDKYEWSPKYGWLNDRYGLSWQLSLGSIEEVGQKISPMLMFTENNQGKAEEAIKFYSSVFENSSTVGILKYKGEENEVDGTIKHAQFKLANQVFMAMDSSLKHGFTFNEAISFVVDCETQSEIDYYWNKLSDGGEESQCGWLKDQFGVSWQIVPSVLAQLMSDPVRSERVVNAFLKMKKFDIETLMNA